MLAIPCVTLPWLLPGVGVNWLHTKSAHRIDLPTGSISSAVIIIFLDWSMTRAMGSSNGIYGHMSMMTMSIQLEDIGCCLSRKWASSYQLCLRYTMYEWIFIKTWRELVRCSASLWWDEESWIKDYSQIISNLYMYLCFKEDIHHLHHFNLY